MLYIINQRLEWSSLNGVSKMALTKKSKSKTPSWHINYEDHAEKVVVKPVYHDPIRMETPNEGINGSFNTPYRGFTVSITGFYLV